MFLRTIIALAVLAASPAAWAQSFPSKPVRVIVTFPPGGTPDIYGRVMAAELQKIWNQSVVVENRTGAGGTIGTDYVAKAAPTAIRCSSPRTHPSPSRRTCIRSCPTIPSAILRPSSTSPRGLSC